MMNYKLIIKLLCAVLVLPAAAYAQSSFSLKGKITNLNSPAKVQVTYPSNGVLGIDSAELKDGSFELHYKVDFPVLAKVIVTRRNTTKKVSKSIDQLSIYLEPKAMQLSPADSIKHATVVNSKINKEYKSLRASLESIDAQYYRIYDLMEKTSEEPKDSTYRNGLKKKLSDIYTVREEVQQHFVREHPESFVSLQIIQSLAGMVPDTKKSLAMINQLAEPVKNSPPGRKYTEYLQGIAKLDIGQMAPLFSQADTAGQMVSLASYKGKYVLIDFWANWCGPCRAENPNVVKSYAKYHDKGLEIMGISLDKLEDKAKWIKAIHDDKLTWLQLCDLKGWENEVARLYNIQGIPQNYLIDPEGKIIAKNLRGAELDLKLGELIK
jgi:peroxiredoxin